MHGTGLIETLVYGLVFAFVGGFLARRIGLSPIVGYMLAGIVVGPHTPGIVADRAIAADLAEIGVMLLMFGVGLHFSVRDLLAVRHVAILGALAQSAAATLLGLVLGHFAGWSFGTSLVFGLALSVASTVVLIRGLADLGVLNSIQGHIAVGWLLVEDLLTVLVLVLLPPLAGVLGGNGGDGGDSIGVTLLWTAGKVTAFLVLIAVLGARAVPMLLDRVARGTRAQSRELFTLAVLSIALGIAFASAELFGVSMALGAFLGGMVVGQSDLSHQAAADALPLRDAFAVLFFVSVGMLIDPSFFVDHPLLLLASLAIVLIAKPAVAIAIVLLRGQSLRAALTVAAGLSQIGEFSFILASLGASLGLIGPIPQNALLCTALVSIALNPVLFALVAPLEAKLGDSRRLQAWLLRRTRAAGTVREEAGLPALRGHAVLCGHGRAGSVLSTLLQRRGWPFLVIDQDRTVIAELRGRGIRVLNGDAGNPILLEHAHLEHARLLLVTTGDAISTRLIVAHARELNPTLRIVARVHGQAEREDLQRLEGVECVLGEFELALEMSRRLLDQFGVGAIEAQASLLDLRATRGIAAPIADTRIHELDVRAGSPALGRRIADLGLSRGTLVVTIRRGRDFVVPDGSTTLAAGDSLLVLADGDGVRQLETLLRDRAEERSSEVARGSGAPPVSPGAPGASGASGAFSNAGDGGA